MAVAFGRFMVVPLGTTNKQHQAGFTITEVVFAMVVLTLASLSCIAALTFSRVASLKAKEQAIALDFLVHYVEMTKGVTFPNLQTGVPINDLFNGADGAPNIRIPTSDSFFSINTTDYKTFHPDLLWIASRNPEMQVRLTTRTVGGVPHDKLLHVELRWRPPLGRGGLLSVAMDSYRCKDL